MKGKRWLLLLACLLICFCVVHPQTSSASGGDLLINEENFPDANFRSSLLQLCSRYIIYDEVPYFTAEGLAAMDSLTVIANDSGNEIVSMQGIEHFYALNHLTIYGGKFAFDPRAYKNPGYNRYAKTKIIIAEGSSVKENTDGAKEKYPYIVSKD